MSLKELATALSISTALVSPSDASQLGSVAASDARNRSVAGIERCLRANPGLEHNSRFPRPLTDNEFEDYVALDRDIERRKLRQPSDRGNQLIIKDI